MATAQYRRQDTSHMLEDAYAKPRELVQEYPFSSTMLVFGIGLGVGMLIGHSMGESPTHRLEHESSKLQGYGRHISDTIRGAVHDAISRYMPHTA
jgi:hypothetical protein